MNMRTLSLMTATLVTSTSCYTDAKIRQIDRQVSQHSKSIIYKYKIRGLQQMLVYISPGRGFIYDKHAEFTQEQLSKLKVSVESLSGPIIVRGIMTIQKGETKPINLRQGVLGRHFSEDPEIGDIGKFHPVISFVSIENSIPPVDCDFILIVKDMEGFTKANGLRVVGGFQDSL
jgi:hypothetical protein